MLYYQDSTLLIRDMEEADAQVFYDEYTAQGWHPEISYYHMRMQDAADGKCTALTAVYRGFQRTAELPAQGHRQPPDGRS